MAHHCYLNRLFCGFTASLVRQSVYGGQAPKIAQPSGNRPAIAAFVDATHTGTVPAAGQIFLRELTGGRASELLGSFDARGLATLAWSLGHLRFPVGSSFEHRLRAEIDAKLHEMTP